MNSVGSIYEPKTRARSNAPLAHACTYTGRVIKFFPKVTSSDPQRKS